jgi:hypothetical protein
MLNRERTAALAFALLLAALVACGGDKETPTPPSATPGADTSASQLHLESTRKAESGLTIDSEGVRISVSRVSIADYAEMYDAAEPNVKQALDTASEARGAQTIGLIEVAIENTTASPFSFDPRLGTVIVGGEAVKFSPPFTSDLSGEYTPRTVKRGLMIFFLKTAPVTSVNEVIYSIPGTATPSKSGRDIQMRFRIEP